MENKQTVFISYTWDNETHKKWVLDLTNYLIKTGGLNVILDQYELTAGKDMNYFMENGLETADKVLIILTEKYKEKADKRQGGTGFEYSMISQNLFELQANNNKFIPILRSGTLSTSAPSYLKTKIYHSMKNDSEYEISRFELSRIIHEKPALEKPPIGKTPNFDSPEIDPIIAIANNLSEKEKLNSELNRILKSVEGVELAKKKKTELFESLEKKAFNYTNKTEFNFEVQKDSPIKTIVINCDGHSVSLYWSGTHNNSTSGAVLTLKTWLGTLVLLRPSSFYLPSEEPTEVSVLNYTVDLNENKGVVWRKSPSEIDDNENIIRMVFTYLIKAIQHDKEKKFRN